MYDWKHDLKIHFVVSVQEVLCVWIDGTQAFPWMSFLMHTLPSNSDAWIYIIVLSPSFSNWPADRGLASGSYSSKRTIFQQLASTTEDWHRDQKDHLSAIGQQKRKLALHLAETTCSLIGNWNRTFALYTVILFIYKYFIHLFVTCIRTYE